MTMVFADTSFYIAFSNPKDRWNEAAKAFAMKYTGEMLTTEFVLAELANHLCTPQDRGLFLRFYEMLRKDVKTRVLSRLPRYAFSAVSRSMRSVPIKGGPLPIVFPYPQCRNMVSPRH